MSLALLTLWLLSVLIFVGGSLLPGDVGRSMLGPFADANAVAALNHALGTDRPVLAQYADWLGNFVMGDMGISHSHRSPAAPLIADALANSLKLGFLALVIVVPLSIVGGVCAALYVDRPLDRVISVAGLTFSALPEFVTGLILILIFCIWNNWLPLTGSWPPGSGLPTQLYHLLLPSIPLVLVLFGYFARMIRAGTIEVLEADYIRTAVLKGLPPYVVLTRHVLRNSLPPAIAVISTQIGYLIGGLVVVEILFRYRGIGELIYTAARQKDFALLEASILTVGIVYTVATLIADILYSLLNPRVRLNASE